MLYFVMFIMVASWVFSTLMVRFCKMPNHLARVQRPIDLQSCQIRPTPVEVDYFDGSDEEGEDGNKTKPHDDTATQDAQQQQTDDGDDTLLPPPPQFNQQPELIPSDCIYLPPSTPDPSESNPHLVYIIIAGNPGASGFYIEYLDQIHQQFDGKVHGYALGHGFHTAVIDPERFERYTTAQVDKVQKGNEKPTNFNPKQPYLSTFLPEFDSHRLPNSTVMPSNALTDDQFLLSHEHTAAYMNVDRATPEIPLLNLKQQIAQKFAIIAKIRKRHPNAKIAIAGHSMGSYCMLEVLRNVERAWIMKYYGEVGLFMWDVEEENVLSSSDHRLVENSKYPINIPQCNSDYVNNIPNKISRLLFGPSELKLWMDDMMINTPHPKISTIPTLPSEIATNTVKYLDELDTDIYDENRKLEEQYQKEMIAHIKDNIQYATIHFHSLHGLMPTIMRIANTPNGHFMTPWFHRRHILAIGVGLIANLPTALKHALINVAAPLWSAPTSHITIRMFLNEIGIHNCIFLATDEMYNIRSLDLNFISRLASKFFIYMSDADEWAPKYQREYLQNVNNHWQNESKDLMTIKVDTEGAEHAFVFTHNHVVAKHSADFIKKL